jgi:hypothetical protein
LSDERKKDCVYSLLIESFITYVLQKSKKSEPSWWVSAKEIHDNHHFERTSHK